MSIKSISLMSIVGWASLGFGAITTSFEGGLPSNWTIASQWKTAYFEGTKYLCSNIAQSKSGTSGLAKLTTSVDEDKLPICNNVVAEVVLSNTMPSDLSLVDELQVVVSTNNWVSSIPVGKPFKYYDSNTSASWRTNNVYASIAGLVNCREFYFGIKVIAAGWSSNNIFIKALTVDFLAGATCTDIHFLDDKKPQIGDENSIIAATINKEPETAISDLTVWAEIKRNGFVYTNQMFEAEAGIFTNDVLKVDSSNIGYAAMPPIDAGDNLKVDVFTKYASSMGAIGEPDGVPGRYIEKSMAILSYTVPQLGSVWINEFSLDKVELCGTINRSYIQGWALELVDSSLKVVGRKEFGNSFNFKTNMPNKMIGLLTYDLGWEIKELNNPYSLRLINAAGVVEHPIEDLNLTVSGSVFGKTGIATWPEQGTAYDWSGTATNDNIFAWGKMDSASFGRVNEGQIFEIENKGWFQAQALASAVKGLSEGLEFANVSYEIDFSSGKIGASKQTDANGLIPVTEFSGAHTNEEFVIAKLAVSAFGWEALPEFYPLLFGVTNYNIAVTLTPAIARDYFSTGRIESYWKNAGTRNFNYASSGGNGYARFDSRQATAEKHYAELRCQNPIRTRGKGLVAISFSVRNDLTFGVDLSDFAYIQIATNKEFSAASVVADSMAVSNKIVGVNTGVWNTGLTFVRLPDSVSELTPLYAKIRGEAGGWSSVYLDVDDIRIAFQDMVEINDLRLTGEGKNIGFEIDAEPLCADGQSVSNVSAQVVMDVGGTVFTNFWTSKSGAIATNLTEAMTFKFSPEAISAGLMAARGYPLREHETFKYWAQVTYYADSRDTDSVKEWETRYFPDNMTRESEDRWTVRGKYAIDMTEVSSHYTYSVPGGPISQNEGVELFVDDPTKAKFSVRAYDETGAGITNVTVRLSTEGEEDKVFTTNVTGDVCFDYDVVATGLVANAKYVVSVTGVNANGQQLTQDPFVFEFETLPEMPTAAIEAVSTSELKLTVSGKAAGYVVDTAGWAQSSANTWVKGKRSPNTLLEETILIYGTNQVGAVSATNAFEAACYTLAAVATKAPVIQKGTVTVEVGADQDYVAENDSNPELTEYAVRVTTSDGGDALVTTNGVEVWKTLADWKVESVTVEKPTIDLLATNYFSFITRNFDKTVSRNDSPVTTNCWFDMSAAVVGAEQTATFGKVNVALQFGDPAQSADARAEVEYKIVGKGDWTPVESFDVPFDAVEQATNITWDAWTAVGETEGVYEYLLRTKVTDAAHDRSSGWVEMAEAGTLDFVKPTVTLKCDTTPDPFNQKKSPMVVEVKFSKSVTGFDEGSLEVGNGNAVVTGEGDTYTVSVTPKTDGVVTVQVLADKVADQFGNKNKASDPLSRTFDTKPPVIQPIEGEPGEMVVTNGNDFAFTVSATDESTLLKYHWTTNKVEVADNETHKLEGKDAREGTNVVTVCAEDAAGNSSTNVFRTWVVDTIAPTEPTIDDDDKPAKVTRSRSFSLTASSVDATKITFWWSLNGAAGVRALPGEAFERDGLADGEYTVSVYATDEAMNVSPTNHYSWTIDNVAPDNLKIEGRPTETPFVTTEPEVNLTASATDNVTPEDKIAYTWTFNGLKSSTTALLDTTAQEGTNSAKVVATDEAGNPSELTRTWVVDTHCPTNLVISGWPMGGGSPTNEPNFSLTATAMDATAITFWWSLDGAAGVRALPGTPFTNNAELPEGNHVVFVYATDEAVNVSETNYWAWTVDRTPPAVTNLTSTTPDPFGKGTEFLEVEVMFNEPVVGFGMRSVFVDNRAEVASVEPTGKKDGTSYLVRISPGDDGLITVKIEGEKVKDRAGNWNTESGTLTRTYDTKPPENFTFEATPKNTEVVATSNFNFAVSATDTTTVTYYWKTNEADYVALSAEKKDGAWVANFEGFASEGTNTLSVYGTDQLGNPTVTNSIWWVVDTIAPTVPVIDGTPADGAYTKEQGYSYTAKSEDATILTYFWTLNGGDETEKDAGEAFAGSGLADGGYTVSVYAKDEAGNVSAATNWNWTVDTVSPKVTLKSSTPTTFNEYKVPLIVDVAFTEPVVGFNGDCVTVTRGVVTNWTGSGSSYTVYIDPDEEGEGEPFVPVSVKIEKGAVTDPAGNDNEASNVLEFKNVTKLPTVTLTTETPDAFNSSKLPFVVTAEFVRGKKLEPAIVTNFTEAAVSVENGTVSDISPNFATNIYTFIVTPKGEGVITVRIPEEVVADEAGNLNEPSDPLMRTYDNSIPTGLKILGTPEAGKVTASQEFAFSAEADDLTTLTYYWTLTTTSGVVKADYASSNFVSSAVPILAPKGTNTVSVYAIDAAGNKCLPFTRTWVVDWIPPQKLTLSGMPGEMGTTNVTRETSFSYTASATDDTKITYHWLTNGVEVVDNLSTKLVGTAIEGTNTVSVYATDEADNVSVTNTILWVVDTIAPTVPVISGTPADKSVTKEQGYSYTATSEDATILTYIWKLDGGDETEKDAGEAFSGSGLADGGHQVVVYAKDEAGNESAATNWTWTVDTTKPTDLKVWGLPISDEKIIVTNGNDFAFEASATDATALRFHWATNGVAVTDITSSNFVGKVGEGTNTVSVYAEDAAGNVCDPIARTWVVDTIAPTVPVISGTPADKSVTKEQGYSYTAKSEDATKVEFWWSLDGAAGVRALPGVPFAGDGLTDGGHKVAVYAKDEAGNKSAATNWTWTVDTTKPTDMKVWGLPISDEKIVVTNGNDFAFEASANDATALKFHWATNGVAVTDITSSNFVGQVGEGTNTVSVYAEDAAGNVCDPIARTWVVDTIDPTVPVIDGNPKDGAITKETGYSYTAESEDATKVEFWWSLDGAAGVRALPGVPFAGDGLADGVHKVAVYAKDEAGNESAATNWTWTVDTTKPTDLKVWGLPISDEKIVVTNCNDFAFEASANDATALKFHWATNGVAVTDCTTSNFVGQVGEGTNTVSVYAEDAAGNVCDPVTRTWVVDTTDPTVPVIEGEPADGAITQQTGFSYTAESEDATKVEFWWSLDGAAGVRALPGVPFAGDGLADGAHSVGVYAKDEAGNKSGSTNWTWTVDTTAPTNLKVWGLPISDEKIVVTNGFDFAFEASATDATVLKFHWATNGVAVTDITSSNFVGRVGEGTNTVSVYAEDAAGNVCNPVERAWVVDTIAPTVPVISGTPTAGSYTNVKEFDFDAESTDATLITYHWKLNSKTSTEKNFIGVAEDGDGDYTVYVYATDEAGNVSSTNSLSWTLDTTPPTVRLSSKMRQVFKRMDLGPDGFVVDIEFSEKVTGFSAKAVSVVNGTVNESVTGSGDTYAVKIMPKEDGPVVVRVLPGMVADLAGNWNVASAEDTLTRSYDTLDPTKPTLTGWPENGSTTNVAQFCLTAHSFDTNGIARYVWFVNDVMLTNEKGAVLEGIARKGVNTVKVCARDHVNHDSENSDAWTWTVEDDTPGEKVDFGGGVYLEVNPTTHETNGVSFTAVDFHPGEASTVTMSGFGVDPLPQSDVAPNISGLRMKLIVCDTLEDTRWKVTVDSAAYYDLTAKELTVTIPEDGTKGGDPVEPYKSFFVFGVENIEE